MKLTLSTIALCVASAAALPSGSLFARRLPSEFNEALVERNSDGKSGSYPYDSGVINYKDPASNKSIAYPTYRALSAFDYASFNLGLHQEYIELDLFNNILARFSDAEFDEAGINAQYREIIRFFAHQEINHATLLSNILGPGAAQQCKYQYPFNTVREAIDFCQKLTRWGESGVYGFLSQLNSEPSATLLTSSIVTEARQQYTFRQLSGAFPVPESFVPGIPQAWQWTLLHPYITSCPSSNPPIQWSAFPALNVTKADGTVPSLVQQGSKAAVSTNVTVPILPGGAQINFKWENPGKKVGPDMAYTTSRMTDKAPAFAVIISHINATYVPLFNISGNSAIAYAPDFSTIFPGQTTALDIGVANSTAFIALTDAKVPITPHNLTLINAHVVAGPAMIQLG